MVNITRALEERVFHVEGPAGLTPPPVPAPGAYSRLSDFRSQLLKRIGGSTPVTRDQFVDMYRGRRRTIYSSAAQSLLTRPVELKDAYLSAFVKAEKLNLSAKADPCPRVIQPRHPRYNVEVGKYLKHLEHRVYDAIAAIFGHPVVMKGYNANEVGRELADAWGAFWEPVGIGLDASRFDQHVSEAALKWEHSVYVGTQSGTNKDELRRLLRMQIVNKGFARCGGAVVKYKVRGSRMSGDMNTALGNCLIMTALVHRYCAEKNLKVRLLNNGDDCMLIMERSDLYKMDGLPAWFLEMGFTMKVEEPVYELEQCVFCQTQPVLVQGEYRMVRDPRVSLAKDACSFLPIQGEKAARRYLGTLGDCGLALNSGVPVQQAYFQGLRLASGGLRMGECPAMESGMAQLATRMKIHEGTIDADSRVSYWKAFGITPDHQLALEAHHGAWRYSHDVTRREYAEDPGYPLQW